MEQKEEEPFKQAAKTAQSSFRVHTHRSASCTGAALQPAFFAITRCFESIRHKHTCEISCAISCTLAPKKASKSSYFTSDSGNSFPAESNKKALDAEISRIQDISEKWRQCVPIC